ncbi:MAG TPA: hypothetical protein DCR21_00910, partial [Succinivibrionaceae bacterium]|nr:hypothetical protein [Succinivibrionaceae bacterium]
MNKFILSLLCVAVSLVVQQAYAKDSSAVVIQRTVENHDGSNLTACAIFNHPLEKSPDEIGIRGFLDLTDSSGRNLSADAVIKDSQLCLTTLKPGTAYSLTVKKGLRFADGAVVQKDLKENFSTSDALPSVTLAHGNIISDSRDEAALTLDTINLSDVKISLFRLNPKNLSAADLSYKLSNHLDFWQLENLIERNTTFIDSLDVQVKNVKNETVHTSVKIKDILKDKEVPEMMLAIVSQKDFDAQDTNGYREYDDVKPLWFAKIICISDLGISAYQGKDSFDVALRSLKTAEPVQDAEVSIYSYAGEKLSEVRTDDSGYAHFDSKLLSGKGGARPQIVIAHTDKDFISVDLRSQPLNLTDYTAARQRYESDNFEAYAYTERGIYRPSETVHFNALIRDTELNVSDIKSAVLIVTRPDGTEVFRQKLEPSVPGAFAYDFKLPSRGSQGAWHFDLTLDGSKTLCDTFVSVRDFMPLVLSAKPAVDNKAPLDLKNLRLGIKALFNYGATAEGLTASGSLTLKPDAHPVAGFDDYFFGPAADSYQKLSKYSYLNEETTDQNGEAYFNIGLENADYARLLTFRANVYDKNGNVDALDNIDYRLQCPFALLGAKKVNDSSDTTSLSVISVNQDGTSAAQEVQYQVYRLIRDYQYAFVNNSWTYIENVRKQPVASGKVIASIDKKPNIELDLKPGSYLAEINSDRTKTSYSFGVGYSGAAISSYTPEKLELVLDKEVYRPDEDVSLSFYAMADGYADLAVGSSSLVSLRHYPVKKGDNTITIKAGDFSLGSYALLNVCYGQDAGLPVNRAVGLGYINIDNSSRNLGVRLSSDNLVKPEAEFKAQVEFSGGSGDTYYTAALVDTGITALTRFKAPDPFAALTTPHPFGVELFDLYSYLVQNSRELGQGYGADESANFAQLGAGSLESLARKNVVMFMPAAKAADGKGEISFRLPKHQGSLELMLVAWNDSALGSFHKKITVRDKAVVTLNSPLVLHTGDNLKAALDIHNLELDKGDFSYSVSCEGAVKCASKESQTSALKGKRASLELALNAENTGSGKVLYQVKGSDGFSFTDEKDITVAHPYSETFVNDTFLLKPKETKTISSLAGFESDTLFTVSRGSVPFLNKESFVKSLCTRNSYSAYDHIFTALGLASVIKQMPKEAATDQDRKVLSVFQQELDALISYVNPDGSIRVFQQSQSDNAATVLAADVLYKGRDLGFSVNEDILVNITDRIKIFCGGENTVSQSAALDFMNRTGQQNLATARYAYDFKDIHEPLALAFLSKTLYRQGDAKRAEEALRTALNSTNELVKLWNELISAKTPEKAAKLIEKIRALDSASFTNPMVDCLFALNSAIECKNDALIEEFSKLMPKIHAIFSVNTSTSMALLLSADEALGGTDVKSTEKLDLNAKNLSFSNDTDKNQFVTVSLLGYQSTMPKNQQNGMAVRRSFFLPDGTQL